MTRVVSLFLPTWPTDRARRKSGNAAPPRDVPLVLAGDNGRRREILAADAAAQAAGLRVSMPATKAQALVPGLVMLEADPAADLEALGRLAVWALRRYAPVVSVDPPDGLVIDTTGADHLHGGEEAMLNDMVVRLAASGIEARAAVADTWGAAHAFARHLARPAFVSPRGTSASLFAPLPVAALRVARDTVAGLHALGLDTIGDLLAQPRAPLVLRFGPQLGRRLDQALGHIGEPIETIRPPETVEVRRAFAEPISAAETISRYLGKMVPELCAILETKGLGARCLDLLCHRVDSRAQAVRVGMGQPVRDAVRLTRLLREKIGTIEPGFGIEMMSLAATIAEPLRERQAVWPEHWRGCIRRERGRW